MVEPATYNATYSDNFGTVGIVIKNDFKNLSTEIDGVKFSGSEFSDLTIDDKTKYSPKQLERFTFLPSPVWKSDKVNESIRNCSFRFPIPVLIIDKANDVEIHNALSVEYQLGSVSLQGELEYEKIKLSLSIRENEFEGAGDLFEVAFDHIQREFGDRYCFKNCYGCMYGDYSVYGQSAFGTMLCFANQKEKYLESTTKSEYMELTESKLVQEIFCCDQFEIRKKGVGYRG